MFKRVFIMFSKKYKSFSSTSAELIRLYGILFECRDALQAWKNTTVYKLIDIAVYKLNSKILYFHLFMYLFFSTGFYSPYRTLAFLNGLLDPQTFGRTPWLGDQSNTRPLPKHRTTQHRNTHTHIHALSRVRNCYLNTQVVVEYMP
jgi:hypothetical protein